MWLDLIWTQTQLMLIEYNVIIKDDGLDSDF